MTVETVRAAIVGGSLVYAFWFLAAMFLLDLFDISLPRGDSVGVGGALCAAALLVLLPAQAAILGLVSVTAAAVIRFPDESPRRVSVAVAGRLGGLAAGTLLLRILPASSSVAGLYLRSALVAAAFLFADLVVSQTAMGIGTSRPVGRLIRGNIRIQAPLLAAKLSASVLTVITHQQMGSWSIAPVVAVLLLMRQSYSLLLDIRETYRSTVEVLVEAAEGQDERRVGHAERSAAIARSIGMKIGLAAEDVERISYAALLHDVDAIADETEGLRSFGDASQVGHSSAVLADAGFFSNVIEIVRLCDGEPNAAAGASPGDLLAAFIVALASDVDATDHPQVAAAHHSGAVERVAGTVPAAVKARAVGAALSLGYKTPAVS